MRKTLVAFGLAALFLIVPSAVHSQMTDEQKKELFLKARQDIHPVPRASASATPRPKPRTSATPRATPEETPEPTATPRKRATPPPEEEAEPTATPKKRATPAPEEEGLTAPGEPAARPAPQSRARG